MRIPDKQKRTPGGIGLQSVRFSPAQLAEAVEAASTLATLDNFQQAAICCWPLISNAISVSPGFGISAANVEMLASDLCFSFAWIASSIEYSKEAQSQCDKFEGACGKSRFPDGNAPERYPYELSQQ